MAEEFRFIYLAFGFSWADNLLTQLVRCKHECRCSHVHGADVSFRDVTIKIPDRGCDQGCEWHDALEAWAEIWEKSVVIETWASPDEFVHYGCCTWWGADGKASIERWYLSYVEKPLNSKVIKSFVPELRSCKCFSGFLCYICALGTLWTFCVPVWICLFHVFMDGYVTLMLRLQLRSSGECGVLLYYHYSQVHSDLEW